MKSFFMFISQFLRRPTIPATSPRPRVQNLSDINTNGTVLHPLRPSARRSEGASPRHTPRKPRHNSIRHHSTLRHTPAQDAYAADYNSDEGKKWSEMDGGEKAQRVLSVLLKLCIVLGALYMFICSLSFLANGFRLGTRAPPPSCPPMHWLY